MARDRVTAQEAETDRTVGIEPATKPSWSRVEVAAVLQEEDQFYPFARLTIRSLQLSQPLPSFKLYSKFYKIKPVRRSLHKVLGAMPHEGAL